ncbi:methyltransferase domain-containing protein [Hyphomonas sp.]|uniref:class I SAM-dependent methyltransferase n=1 Tax=Hyphomonas sp. TaxID=87 RepID=UPI0025B8546B|nr:methyltransferase domain-containing protein [Hyphomonas sp.]
MKTLLLVAVSALALAACTPAKTPAPASVEAATVAVETAPAMTLAEAVASDLRSDEEKARDVWRNPVKTLEFFGVESDDKVVEVWPGGGWYTNILAPWLASGGGTLVAAGFDAASIEDAERRARTEQRLAEFKATYADPKFGTIEHTAFSATSGPLTADGTADVVLTFRNIHNWMGGGYTEKFFADAYTALKPGGVLGVVEHRLPSTQAQDPKATSGYVHEDYVKALATAAGFEFVEASEINANTADTADHPFGVWTLPPNLATTDRDGKPVEGFDPEKYKAIGESDRMTLKFRKPE